MLNQKDASMRLWKQRRSLLLLAPVSASDEENLLTPQALIGLVA